MRWWLLSALLIGGVVAAWGIVWAAPPTQAFGAVFWQPDCASAGRISDYRRLGATRLILQWTTVERENFSGTGASGCNLDWPLMQARSGKLEVVAGLNGRYHPTPADLPRLGSAGRAQARVLGGLPFRPALAGFYAPVELQPDWPAGAVRTYLDALPRPLWISAYAGAGRYDATFVTWLSAAVPRDVHLMIQDGVGVGHATPAQAAATVRALEPVFGAGNVSMIVEVFRPGVDGRLRSALPWELDTQLWLYRDFQRVAFDGGHYMSDLWIRVFVAYRWLRSVLPSAPGGRGMQPASVNPGSRPEQPGFLGRPVSRRLRPPFLILSGGSQ